MACEVDDQTASLPPLLLGFSEVPIYCWVSRGSDRPNLGPHALMANTLTQSFFAVWNQLPTCIRESNTTYIQASSKNTLNVSS